MRNWKELYYYSKNGVEMSYAKQGFILLPPKDDIPCYRCKTPPPQLPKPLPPRLSVTCLKNDHVRHKTTTSRFLAYRQGNLINNLRSMKNDMYDMEIELETIQREMDRQVRLRNRGDCRPVDCVNKFNKKKKRFYITPSLAAEGEIGRMSLPF